MLTRKLAAKIFEAFSIERWNDLLRPFPLTEMEKAAERSMLAYIIGKFEEADGKTVDWTRIIYGSLFDLLKKIALCDIKSPVQRMIAADYPQEYIKLNEWVIEQYASVIDDPALLDNFSAYLLNQREESAADGIYKAAHKYATLREFEIIKRFNDGASLLKIEKQIYADLSPYMNLRGIRLLIDKRDPYDFLRFIEQLRYQTRWNQTPRVPKTSVLGHSYFVAAITLLMGRTLDLCPKRTFNNFFSALFHDLPESVTRDIISPVKQATRNLPEIVKKIEEKFVERELLPVIDPLYRGEIIYFTNNEFENRVLLKNGSAKSVSFDELNERYNEDAYSPVDGALVRAADHIAAFMEADASIRHGTTSAHLRDGRANILKIYRAGETVNGMDVASFFAQFGGVKKN